MNRTFRVLASWLGLRLPLALLLWSGLVLVASGCKHNEGDSVAVTGEGKHLSSETIDQDPLALLPANPVALAWIDARAFFDSPLGAQMERLAGAYLPVGQEAGFVPRRDLTRIVGGIYSTAGADAVAVMTGSFQPDAIKAAADRQAMTPLGVPLVRSRYANNDVYTAANVGFTVVTTHTMLVGSEAGMRRALDRIRDNRLSREIPAWMISLLSNPQAAIAAALDLADQPQVAALSQKITFLQGLRTARFLGNFQPPGINVVGALSYPDATTATAAADNIRRYSQMAALMSFLSAFGAAGPLQNLQVQVAQSDVQLATALDSQLLERLLSMIAAPRR